MSYTDDQYGAILFSGMMMRNPILLFSSRLLCCLSILLGSLSASGCTVIAIADAAVSTTVKVGSAVVGTAVDVTAAGVHAVTGSGKK